MGVPSKPVLGSNNLSCDDQDCISEINAVVSNDGDLNDNNLPDVAPKKKKRSRRRQKPKSRKVQPIHGGGATSKKFHDAPMTKRDLYFALFTEHVGIGNNSSAVARVTMVNWDAEVVLNTFVQVPVPVSDFRNTNITPEDVATTSQNAMTFAKVRKTVERILRGKILIGHNLQEHLNALGLSHPHTDVRDAALYHPFCKTNQAGPEMRHLNDIAREFLNRDVVNPVDACVSILDLYKVHRQPWEQYLVRQTQSNQIYHNPYRTSYVPPPNNIHPRQGMERREVQSYNQQLAMDSQRLPPQMVMSAQDYHARAPSSSWFSLSRTTTPSYVNPHDPPPVTPQATPALSTRAMELLSVAHDDYESAYETSSYYGTSTDHDCSSYHAESLISGSVASESVVCSSIHEETILPNSDVPQQESSSWFSFGKSKSREPTLEPMESLEESEREDIVIPVAAGEDLQEVVDDEALSSSFVPRKYLPSQKTEKQSKWFGFKRSKSPRDQRDDSNRDQDDSLSNSTHSGKKAVSLPEFPDLQEGTGDKQSSWFSFRRSKSPASQKGHSSQEFEPTVPTPFDTVLGPTGSSEETGGEDWLQEVMHPQASTDAGSIDERAWSEHSIKSGGDCSFDNKKEPMEPNQQQEQEQKDTTWFRFLRSSSSKAPQRKGSRILSVVDESNNIHNLGTTLEETTQEGNWLNQVVTLQGDNPTCLNPTWAAPSMGANTEFYSRSRLGTESSIPTVATEEENDDREQFLTEDIVQMEQNLSFLNI